MRVTYQVFFSEYVCLDRIGFNDVKLANTGEILTQNVTFSPSHEVFFGSVHAPETPNPTSCLQNDLEKIRFSTSKSLLVVEFSPEIRFLAFLEPYIIPRMR